MGWADVSVSNLIASAGRREKGYMSLNLESEINLADCVLVETVKERKKTSKMPSHQGGDESSR